MKSIYSYALLYDIISFLISEYIMKSPTKSCLCSSCVKSMNRHTYDIGFSSLQIHIYHAITSQCAVSDLAQWILSGRWVQLVTQDIYPAFMGWDSRYWRHRHNQLHRIRGLKTYEGQQQCEMFLDIQSIYLNICKALGKMALGSNPDSRVQQSLLKIILSLHYIKHLQNLYSLNSGVDFYHRASMAVDQGAWHLHKNRHPPEHKVFTFQ